MTDRKLLELAAKAAGIEVFFREEFAMDGAPSNREFFILAHTKAHRHPTEWNPLRNDGDALRIAVKLWLVIDPGGNSHPSCAEVKNLDGVMISEPHGDDENAAVRRAIVRAAASLVS